MDYVVGGIPAYKPDRPDFVLPVIHPPPILESDRLKTFPPSFSLYSTSHSDLLIKISADDPEPLHYISTHGSFSSCPDLVLHSTSKSQSPALGIATFLADPYTVDVKLNAFNPAPKPYHPFDGNKVKLVKEGIGALESTLFSLTIPETERLETFQWKHSGISDKGLTLVQLSTNKEVATFKDPEMDSSNANEKTKNKGEMSFEEYGLSLGYEFQVMAVMSVLVVLEKTRKGGTNHGIGIGPGSDGFRNMIY